LPTIELREVWKSYHRGHEEVAALRNVSMVVPRGEVLSIMGPSGSGKTTILNLIAGLDTPTRGDVLVDGAAVSSMTGDGLTQMRRTKVGIVFQFFNLLPSISAVDNVALPLRAAGTSRGTMLQRASEALAAVGLADRAPHRPFELSGGEMQRVAIARALV